MKNERNIFGDILSQALKLGASDIHILGNGEVFFRVFKRIVPFESILDIEAMEALTKEILVPEQVQRCQNGFEIDTSITYQQTRLRLHCYLMQSLRAFSIRILPKKIPSMEELLLPKVLEEIFTKNSGLVLVSGSTGSGKSTTIASSLEWINQNFDKHIVCIEEPIEYIHQNNKSFFSYREVGKDSLSFDTGIRASLRQDPDIISIGELREQDSIKSALLASQTGHLVVGTTHSTDGASTLARIINSFDQNRPQIATELSFCLQAVISQRLVCADNGRLKAIFEVLIATPAIKTLIREQKFHQIPSQITMGREFGMISFEQSLKNMQTRE